MKAARLALVPARRVTGRVSRATGLPVAAQHLGRTAVASSSILPGLSSRSATKVMLIAG